MYTVLVSRSRVVVRRQQIKSRSIRLQDLIAGTFKTESHRCRWMDQFLKDKRDLSFLVLNSYPPMFAVVSLCFTLIVRVTFLTVAKWHLHSWGLTDPTLSLNAWFPQCVAHNLEFIYLIFHVDVTLDHILIQLSCSYFLSISVQSLFSWRPSDMSSPQPSFFSFKSLIENSKMKVRIYLITCICN